MKSIYVIHGDELPLMEAKKAEIISLFKNYTIETYDDEATEEAIVAALTEESLFGEDKIIIINNNFLFSVASNKKEKKQAQSVKLLEIIQNYTGSYPIIIFVRGLIDKRLKANKDFLKNVDEYAFPRLEKEDLIRWTEQYCKQNGHPLTAEARRYFYGLMDLWVDVPVYFLKTEFDRLFLFLEDKAMITAELLAKEGSDYASKNIFKFTDALYRKDIKTMHELLPFLCNNKEVDRFVAYLASQLQLQLIAMEGVKQGLNPKVLGDELTAKGMKIKSYPLKLAFERTARLSFDKISELLYGLYEFSLKRRKGELDLHAIERLCINYCN